jgi:putative membrane protein (TIGR04086 family)
MPKPFQILLVAKGIVIAAVITLVLTLILSLVYYFTSVQESMLHSFLCLAIGITSASIYTSLEAGSKGLIYGLAVGFGFFLITLIVHLVFYTDNPSWLVLIEKLLISLAAGALGGTLGALLKR